MLLNILTVLLVIAPVFASFRPENCAVHDLSYPFDDTTVYWPTAKPFSLEEVFKGITEKGFFYAANNFNAAEHGGTHLDAPVHFHKGGWTVDQIPLTKLMGEACVVDVTHKTVNAEDYAVTADDIRESERVNGALGADCIALFLTGWGQFYPDKIQYLGTNTTDTSLLHFPGLSTEAALYLRNRNVRAVGIDTASIDPGQSTLFQAHQILGRNNIPVFENVANLQTLPQRGSSIIALPMRIEDGSGAPLRIVAFPGKDRGDPCKR